MIQKIIKNRSKIASKSCKNHEKNRRFGGSGGLLGGSWGLLGGSWGHLGPKRPQDTKRGSEKGELSPPFHPQVGAQNRSKSVPRAIRKVIVFMIGLKIDFWSDLVPTWSHLSLPNPSKIGQVGSKIDPSWSVDLRAIFERM